MSAPNIFLSSTCYDLSSIRSSLEAFLKTYGFNVINSESKKFGVTPKTHSHNACLDQVAFADYLVLIIGGRRGGNYIGTEKTITNEEFNEAQKLGIPTIAFVATDVYSQIKTYKKNPSADFSHVVDDVRIFDFISYISSGHEDNWLHQYANANEIQETLSAQFSYYLKLYSLSLRPKQGKVQSQRKHSFVDFPTNLTALENLHKKDQDILAAEKTGLFELHKAISNIVSADIQDSSKDEKLKTIWLIGRYGDFDGCHLRINEDKFKDRAWGSTKGKRVFSQLEEFGISCIYDQDYDKNDIPCTLITMSFTDTDESEVALSALKSYISQLLKKHDEDSALELFKRADMRIYST